MENLLEFILETHGFLGSLGYPAPTTLYATLGEGIRRCDKKLCFQRTLVPETKNCFRLRQKLHKHALNEHDQKKDQNLQMNDFVEFMWKNTPEFIFEAETVEEIQVKALDWLEDIYNRAKSAGFRSVSSTQIESSNASRR